MDVDPAPTVPGRTTSSYAPTQPGGHIPEVAPQHTHKSSLFDLRRGAFFQNYTLDPYARLVLLIVAWLNTQHQLPLRVRAALLYVMRQLSVSADVILPHSLNADYPPNDTITP